MPGGFIGKYCIVDLTAGVSEEFEPGEAFYKKYLSGYGMGAAVITTRQKPGVDPLAPGNTLGFCSGLLTGTGAYFSGRFMVVGKSPLTGGWGDANAGGYLSLEIKKTGYDAVFFTGQAEVPVWVYVTPEKIEIKDASSLWGKDAVETQEIIRNQLGNKRIQVACIGISGEKLSRISGIVTDGGRLAARSGLGALMGSKNLKAFAVNGDQKIPVVRPEVLKTVNREFLKGFKRSKTTDKLITRFRNVIGSLSAISGLPVPPLPSTVKEVLKRYGTSGFTAYYSLVGDMPIKNWGGVARRDYPLENVVKISGDNLIRLKKRPYACQACPLACGAIIDIDAGPYKGLQGHRPEYETLGAFGGLVLHDNLEAIIEINEMCNRAGLDTISAGTCVAFAIECYENGIIDEKTTGGLKLGWGKSEEIIRLTQMIIHREGFGDILADGVKRASEKIAKGSEKFAMHVGGQEISMHDSRLDPGFAIAYQCEPTPARHTTSCYLYASLFGLKKKFPQVRRRLRRIKDKAAKNLNLFTAGMYYAQLLNGCGMCLFGALASRLPVIEYLNAATGWDMAADEYLKIGERILNLRKAFNIREGVRHEGQGLNQRAAGVPPLSQGPLKGITLDMEGLQKQFFEIVDWRYPSGVPTQRKMRELGIELLFDFDADEG
ncbi:MAG: aldehyde ferredoxin oxidoreductase family protein [Desulfobacterales bacterium]|jgi:aldehyde:ferredoxin oxidoreductase